MALAPEMASRVPDGSAGWSAAGLGALEDDMRLTLMTAGLLTSALTLAPAPEARADVRVGVGVRIGSDYRESRGTWRYG